ncbi:MAG TPA: UbiA family prenyltransferase [Anaerolineales bacterium]|nr:UbiA family prenyltransferase [Anaerolineales bacterium]HLE73581.1 UbiA family prenyltransferase [Anaerolineales bacterium]
MAKILEKSVITCDMEGRIETFGDGSERMFGYSKEEVIGRKRVSLFSPGQVVLQYVPQWLATASIKGEYVGRTVFLRKNGQPFAAEIRITPTFKDGVQSGFCGVTEELQGLDPKEAMPSVSPMTRIFSWLVITRAPFLTAIIVPILIGAAWVATLGLATPFPWRLFLMVLFGGIALHVAANTFNDYFDWKSGADPANNDYFLPYSGGSRSIELGLVSERSLFIVASVSLLVSAALGLLLALESGWGVLAFGAVGAFCAFFYTAPPIRLAARRGLGELAVGLNFGPLAVAGTVFALTGGVALADFLAGVPIGLLTIAILWINQFPDEIADKAAGKHNLVVVLGKARAAWGYVLIMLAAFGLAAYWTLVSGTFPIGALLILGGVPLAYQASRVILREYAQRSLMRANAATIKLHAVAGALMAAGILWSGAIGNLLGM